MHAQHYIFLLQVLRHLAHLDINLVRYRGQRLYVARRLAIGTWSADGAFERLLDAFAGDGYQAEIVELKDFRWRAVVAEFFLERLHHALAVAAFIHVDEVDDDDAAEVAQANLANDFFDRVHVGFDNGVFEARGFAYVFAGIDVDGDE